MAAVRSPFVGALALPCLAGPMAPAVAASLAVPLTPQQPVWE